MVIFDSYVILPEGTRMFGTSPLLFQQESQPVAGDVIFLHGGMANQHAERLGVLGRRRIRRHLAEGAAGWSRL
jgi:hypothetical protein